MDPATFEWDRAKDEENRRKHGVAFNDAISAFMDPLSITIADPDHSFEERRFVLLGEDHSGQLLVVIHADREDHVRIISARKANRHERRRYEEA